MNRAGASGHPHRQGRECTLARQIHDRMPVLLGHQIGAWVNGEAGAELLKPAPAGALRMWPVSRRVNKSTPAGDDRTLIDEVALDAAWGPDRGSEGFSRPSRSSQS
ncbi:MAG: SOS response-associated peptidase family protein [Xanthobacteraceae bacterium]